MVASKSWHQSSISLAVGKDSILEENTMKVVKEREIMEDITIYPEMKILFNVYEISVTEFNNYKDLGTQES